ncbi:MULTISPECIES: DUF5329 family protein [unclassified Pseudoalteromonas]|uniref:DUF5329 family protein n=1 Tax=unclassified Pseudoalteromonas TaxID=194690 RepID=UPI0020977BD2|nr:DUF5329 family protein [Pseudoalteromonas sp. XMcav2-N]MCO7187445.1 DUF5329 domain-containing protein [Pseudoalteromonas sp. XMcav2-N]
MLSVFLFGTVLLTAQSASISEINHLLMYVAKTQCQYERNGTLHTGAEAVEHIKKKYDYFYEDIETAEEFIQYAATKSKLSGKHYQVHCDGQPPLRSKDWLLGVLSTYRLSTNSSEKK